MPKVQKRSLPMLPLIIADDPGLDRTAPLQSISQCLRIQGEQLRSMFKAPVSKVTVQNQAVLHHFSQS
ncbi:hypothetical protein D3C81_1773120 [compost metagenome]